MPNCRGIDSSVENSLNGGVIIGAFRLRRAYQMERFLIIALPLLFYDHYTPLYVSDVVVLLS